MAKMTLLEIVQDILSDMSSDNVSSISDTHESQRVAAIVKSTYFKIIEERDWPHLHSLVQLTGLGDVARPTYLQLPVNLRNIDWIKYDKRLTAGAKALYDTVHYLEPLEFLEVLNGRDSMATTTDVVTDTASNVSLLIRNDIAPSYWTTFDDEFIIFDSYDNGIDTTIQQSKVQTFGVTDPTWTAADTFIPDLPSQQFPMLLAQSKTSAFNKMKQVLDTLEERDAKRQRVVMQESHRAAREDKARGYGRRGSTGYRTSRFTKNQKAGD